MRSLLMTVVLSAAVSAMTLPMHTPTENVAPCVCLPYYLCNNNKVAIDGNNSTVTGWGQLDIRIGDNGIPISPCQESPELCCTNPRPVPDIDPVEVTPNPPPTYRGCGYANPVGLDFSLLGGTGRESLFGQYPWVIMLFYKTNYIGSGVLIHPEVVLTVAHKVDNIQLSSLVVRAGEWDMLTTKERLQNQNRFVRDIIKHNEYFGIPYLFNDIALLRLAQPMVLDSHISVICLPEQDENFDSSTNCISNGWGKDAQGSAGKFAVIQKRIELHMIQHHVCDDIFKGTVNFRNKGFWLHDSFVCAMAENGWDTCEGDGGGPLACPFEPNRFKLTGLTSWSVACGDRNIPGAYVAVSKFRTWINSILAGWGLDLRIPTSTSAPPTVRPTISPPIPSTILPPTGINATTPLIPIVPPKPTTVLPPTGINATTPLIPIVPPTIPTTVLPPITTIAPTTPSKKNCTCTPQELCEWGAPFVTKFGTENPCPPLQVCCTILSNTSTTAPTFTSSTTESAPPPRSGCGYANPGGLEASRGSSDEASFGEYPWVVTLLDNNKYAGVGVLIHPQVVLTTAHKAVIYYPNLSTPGMTGLTIRAGEWDLMTTNEKYKHQDRAISDVVIHPEFNMGDYIIKRNNNDVALLRLAQPVDLTSHINVVCLPEKDENFDGATRCITSGWGKTANDVLGKSSLVQKLLEQDIMTRSQCVRFFKRSRLGTSFKLDRKYVCAKNAEGKDNLESDDHAPLACPVGGDRYKLTGLMAWQINEIDMPDAYVAISKFREWIDAKLGEWNLNTSAYKLS